MITLQDVEVLLGIPIDGEAIVGTCDLGWAYEYQNMLGIVTHPVVLQGQRIHINKLLEKVDQGLLDGATEVTVHQYARCYILALLGDTIFADKFGDRVHTMWLQMLRDLRNPPDTVGEALALHGCTESCARQLTEVPVRLVGP